LGADPCRKVTEQSCNIAKSFNSTLSLNYTCPATAEYYMYILNCDQAKINLKIDLELMNPGGDHLDFGEIPFPAMYMVLTAMWGVLTALWCYNWIINRTQKVKLHRVISIFPLGKLAYCVIAYAYWKLRQTEGMSNLETTLAYGFAYIGFKTIFYTILLFIASGWGTVKDGFGTDKYFIGTVAIFLTGTLLAGFLLHGLFLLMSFVLYIVIIVMVFRWVARSLLELEVEIRNNPHEYEDPNDPRHQANTNSARSKEVMFRRFKIIMLAYIGVIMIIVLMEILFLMIYEWVSEMLSELLEMLMFVCIGYTFRLRRANIYYMLPTTDDSVGGQNLQGIQ